MQPVLLLLLLLLPAVAVVLAFESELVVDAGDSVGSAALLPLSLSLLPLLLLLLLLLLLIFSALLDGVLVLELVVSE